MDGRVLDALPMAVSQLDADGRLVAANDAWHKLIDLHGARPGTLIGLDYVAVCERARACDAKFAGELARSLRDVLAGRSEGCTRDYACPVRGKPAWYRVDVRPLPGGGAVVVHTDITQQRRAIDEAEAAARLDPLTGVLNRRAFQELLRRRLGTPSDRPAALLVIDLDRFKAVNDRFGHAAGDLLLCALAGRLRHTLRPHDQIARMGGDEFVVMVERVPSDQSLSPLVERIRNSLQEPVAVGRRRLEVGASIGAVRLSGTLVDADEAIAMADRRMYADKRARHGGSVDAARLAATR
jgi:diguanylate cyclase (GGDEF)-like protein